ncbi:MAG: ABC transporter permease [Vicinamibacterales bacterium]
MDWKQRIRLELSRTGTVPDEGILDELAQHARAMYDSARADGASREEAEHRVDLQIAVWAGDAPLLKRPARGHSGGIRRACPERAHLSTRVEGLTGIAYDIRYALRLFRRQASFSLLVIVIMALGIGATTTLFSVTYGVLMKPLPWPQADRLVVVKETRGGNRPRFGSFSNAAYLAWREQASTIDGLAAWSSSMATLTGVGEVERIRVATATASLFPVLGARPLLGSFFTDEDERAQPSAVVVLSERLWRQRFSADPAIVGRSIQLDGRPRTVVGVLPDHLAYPDRETLAWVPFHVRPATGNFLSMFEAIARLRPGAAPSQAVAEGSARGRDVPDTGMTTMAIFGGNGPVEISAVPLHEALTTDVRRPLVVLLAAVVLLLVTAVANIASLQLARATARRREMAIRAALGAGAARVTRQLVIESLLLGLTGGAAGVALAVLLHRVLPSMLPADFPRVTDVGLGVPVIAFSFALCVLASVAFGAAPALRARRLNLVESLSDDGAAPAGARTRTARVRLLIMAGQVAIACVLLVGAALFGRSFVELLHADRGFDPSSVLTARLQLPNFAFTAERRSELVAAVVERLRAVPSVTFVTYSNGPPLGIFGGSAFTMDARQVQASSRDVDPGYFAAMGMRILSGRDFSDEDVASGRPVFVVNRTFARQYLSDRPVGQHVRVSFREGGPEPWEIIGIVDDVLHRGVTEPGEPEIYLYRERHESRVAFAPTLIVRTSGDPASLAPTLRAIVRQQDPSVVVDSVMTMEERLMTGLARPRLYAVLLAGFAGLALVIAAVGLFGVMSYTVAQRSRELAVRSALGARRSDIVRLVLREGLTLTAVGLAAGLLLSAWLTRTIAALLYGVSEHDPLTYAAVPIVLLLAAALACIVPARRASRLDPLQVLKAQ